MNPIKLFLERLPVSFRALADMLEMPEDTLRSRMRRNSILDYPQETLLSDFLDALNATAPSDHQQMAAAVPQRYHKSISRYLSTAKAELSYQLASLEMQLNKLIEKENKYLKVLHGEQLLRQNLSAKYLDQIYYQDWLTIIKNTSLRKLNSQHYIEKHKLQRRIACLQLDLQNLEEMLIVEEQSLG